MIATLFLFVAIVTYLAKALYTIGKVWEESEDD
jgi:hypothetical protein